MRIGLYTLLISVFALNARAGLNTEFKHTKKLAQNQTVNLVPILEFQGEPVIDRTIELISSEGLSPDDFSVDRDRKRFEYFAVPVSHRVLFVSEEKICKAYLDNRNEEKLASSGKIECLDRLR